MKHIWHENKWVGEHVEKIYREARSSSYGKIPAMVIIGRHVYRASCDAVYAKAQGVLKVEMRLCAIPQGETDYADEIKRDVTLALHSTREEAIRAVITLFDNFVQDGKALVPPSDERTDDEVIVQALAGVDVVA